METSPKKQILAKLDQAGISYQLFEHQRAFTIADCLVMPFMDETITLCKNLFLCNRQQTAYYLLLLCPQTVFRTAEVSKVLDVSRLSFAPESALPRLLHLTAGSVSPLGLYFDKEHAITLCFEQAVKATPKIAFHPCDNSATLVFSQEVFWGQVMPMLGVEGVQLELLE